MKKLFRNYFELIKKIKFPLLIGLLLIGAGLFLGWGVLFNKEYNVQPNGLTITNQSVMSANTTAPEFVEIKGNPVNLSIPNLNIDIPVIDGYYNQKKQVWTLTEDKAQFAKMTQQPNNVGGITFIYGHNNKKVFNKLPKIKVGDRAVITTDNGKVFTYEYVSSVTTKPEDASALSYQGEPILMLQTCTGLWYQNRTLFTFKLVEAR